MIGVVLGALASLLLVIAGYFFGHQRGVTKTQGKLTQTAKDALTQDIAKTWQEAYMKGGRSLDTWHKETKEDPDARTVADELARSVKPRG